LPERKWWKQRPSPVESGDDRHLLARINAAAPIPIEVPAGDLADRDGSLTGDPGGLPVAPVQESLLKETHHRQYGRPWAMGKYIFEFVVEAGLQPEHRLLDFGCGALRLGNWVIPYLDEGNYFGVESHLVSLGAAATYEIPLHGHEQKRPRLLWNEDFAFSHFGTTFDWIVDFSSSQSVKGEQVKIMYDSFAEVLAPGGRLLINPRLGVPTEQLVEWGWKVVRGDVAQRCPLLEGHEETFDPTNIWFELVRI
jgi:hypothetical protein